MRVWLASLLAVAVLSGCVGLDSPGCPADKAALHTPWVDEGFLRTDPAQDWDTVVLQQGGEDSAATVHPAGWTLESERISAAGDLNFSRLRVTPGSAEHGKLHLPYALVDCHEPRAGTIMWDLAPPAAGDAAEPGQGVHVYTAGFYENGTLFYTNIKAIDRSDWPRAGWYAWEGADPLPVYVYDQSREEEPPQWRPPSSHIPATGTPADPILHTAGQMADGTTGLGYFTTIPGFNEALKGLSTTTVRVVRMGPEEAYTRAGNEEHPLYGEALVFYIKTVHVVDLPCPLGSGGLCGVMAPERY